MMASDWVLYGYITLTVGGLVFRPLAARFPNARWLVVAATICQTLGPHWGVIASLRAGAHHVPGLDSNPDVTSQTPPNGTPPMAGH
jgi:hypothetical protein